MEPISHVKLFRGGPLPDWDVPIVIVTFEQTEDDFFFAEYFILYQKSQDLDSCRLSPPNRESVKEFLQLRTPEGVLEDMADAARSDILSKLFQSLPKEQQYAWILGPTYTLTPIEFKDLCALWIRGRVEKPIREMARTTRSAELKHKLNQTLALPHLKFTEEKPASAPPGG